MRINIGTWRTLLAAHTMRNYSFLRQGVLIKTAWNGKSLLILCNSSIILWLISREDSLMFVSMCPINRPFPSYFEPHYESKAKCKVFVLKISCHLYADKTRFHMKSFALNLAFIVRFSATRKWPIIKDSTS